MNNSFGVKHLAFLAATLAVQFLACAAVLAQAAPPAGSSSLLEQIFDARQTGFRSLEGAAQPADRDGNQVWQSNLRPFGLQCNVLVDRFTQPLFFCGNHPTDRQVTPDDPPTNMTDEQATGLFGDIKSKLSLAAPDLNWSDLSDPDVPEWIRNSGGNALGLVVCINAIRNGMAGAPDNFGTVDFEIYAKPVPAGQSRYCAK